MAQKLNKKLVGILVVSIMVLMTVTGFVLLQNLNIQDPSKYVADGDKFMSQGEYDKALQAYNRAFMKDPAQNPDHLVKAAACAIELGEVAKARNFIQYAKVRDAQHKGALEADLDLEVELAPFINNINQWNEVLVRARDMIALPDFAESAKVHYALGRAYLELRKEDATYEEKAEEALKRALELDPTNADVVILRAEQMSRQAIEKEADRQTDEAQTIRAARLSLISAAIDKCKSPEDDEKLAKMKEMKARCMLVDGDVEGGSKLLRDLAQNETTRIESRLMLGRLLTGAFRVQIETNLEEAERLLKSAHEADPKDVSAYFALGTLYKAQAEKASDPKDKKAKLADVRALYETGLEKIDRSKHFRKLANNRARVQFIEELFLMDIASARDATEESLREQALASAEKQVERLKEERPPESLEIRFAMGHLYAARGDVIAATREVEAARTLPEGANNTAVLRLCADLYTRQGQWGTARDVLQKLLPLDAGDPTLYIGMARVLLNLNQATDALIYLKPNEPAFVRQALETNQAAIALRIEAYRQLKQFDLAERESELLGKGAPEDEVRAAQIMIWEGKYADAEKKLQGVLAQNPTNAGAIRTQLQLLEESGRRDEARQFVDGLIAKYPDNRQFKQFRLAFSDDSSAEERDQQFLKFINEEPDEYTRYTSLCGYYERRGEIDKAIEAIDNAERLKPDAPAVIEGQFTLSIRKKDWDRASKYAKRISELNSDGTQGKVAEGRLVLAKAAAARAANQADEARKLNDQAIDLIRAGLDAYPNDSKSWTFLAGAYLDCGRTDDAKATLQRALAINPNNGHASLFMARIAQNEGDETAERRYLTDAARFLPEDEWLKSRQRVYKEKDDPVTGIAYREGLLKDKPDDAENLLLLARLYADPKVAAYDKAADAYQKALVASKNDLGLATEFAEFYGSEAVNRPAEGEKLFKTLFDAEEDTGKKALIAISMGRFYEKQKVLATADRHYRQAAFLDPSVRTLTYVADFYARTNKLKEALEQYGKLIELAKKDEPAKEQDFKSREIAILLNMGDLEKAKVKIDAYIAQFPDDPQGLIFLGAYHRVGGDIEQAKAALDAHLAKDPDNAVALWQRGQLYLLRGRWELAIEDLKKSKTNRPDAFNYQHRIALADALIEAGRSEEAINELQQILTANQDQVLVAESLVDAYTRVRPARFADAENLIYRFQGRFPRDPKWPTLLGKLGELAQDWDKAIIGYEKAAEVGNYQPDQVRALFNAYRLAGKPQKILQCSTEKLSTAILDRMPEALSSLAWACAQLKMREKCYENFDRALAATGGNFQIYAQVIRDIVVTLGPEAALKRAQEESNSDPENVSKLQALVHLLKINNKGEEALQVCNRISENATGDSDIIFARLARGMLLSSDGKHDLAKKEYEEVLKLNPDQPMALNNLAYVLGERMNLPAEALPYAKKAVQLQPTDTNVLDTYGWTLFLTKQYGEAAGTLLRAIDIEGDRVTDKMRNADVRYHLGMLYKQQGKLEDAQAMLESADKLCKVQERNDDLPKKIETALKEVGKSAQ